MSDHRPCYRRPRKMGLKPDRRVSVLLPYPFPGPFSYLVPPDLDPKPGEVVAVPLDHREAVGLIGTARPT